MKTEKKDETLIEKPHEQLSRAARFCIFLIFIALSIVMSGDNGVLSSSKKQARLDLQLEEKAMDFSVLSPQLEECLVRSCLWVYFKQIVESF